MSNSTNQKSIKEALTAIRNALLDDKTSNEKNKENILVLNQIVNDDGTIDKISENIINKNEIKDILNNKILELMEDHFDNWLKKNLPNYIDKHFSKKIK